MITKEQLNRLLFVTTVKLFRSFEELIERYNDYLKNAVETSELPD